jgi:pectate lyase
MVAYSLISLALFHLAAAGPLARRAAPVDELVGYGAAATGGGDGAGTTVSSCGDFETALESGGVISIDGVLDSCGTLDVPGDTTIIGVGADSGKIRIYIITFPKSLNMLIVLNRYLQRWTPP